MTQDTPKSFAAVVSLEESALIRHSKTGCSQSRYLTRSTLLFVPNPMHHYK
jgi:hypothetical protein